MNFVKLVVKELKGSRWTLLLFIALTIVWHLYLVSRMGVWERDLYLGLSTVPFFVLPPWIIGNMLYMLHSEWNTNSIYLLLTLPVRGWKIIGSKLVASVIELVTLGSLSGISMVVFFGKNLLEIIKITTPGIPVTWLLSPVLITVMFYILGIVVFLVLGQFSYLLSRLAGRFKGLIAGTTLFVGLWLYVRLGALFSPLFEWFPDLSVKTWYVMNNVVHMSTQKINMAPVATVIFFTAIIFACTSWLYDRHIEV